MKAAMNLHYRPAPSVDGRRLILRGVAVGVAGGFAEVLVVGIAGRFGDVSATDIARSVATAVHVNGGSAATGLLVHMALAVLLGIALTAAAAWSGFPRARNAWMLQATMCSALGVVWAVNFLLVLPWLSPAFLALMPLPLALLSKLCFGAAAAATLQGASGVRVGLCLQPQRVADYGRAAGPERHLRSIPVS